MSAALSTAPHQTTSISAALTTPPLVPASPSNRRYPSSNSSPIRENHANQQISLCSSPESSRRPSRRQSASGSQPDQSTQQMSSRTISLSVPVPASVTSPQPDRQKDMPAAVPPRTSSNQHTTGTPSSSRRQQNGDRATQASPRHASGDSRNHGEYGAGDDLVGQTSRSRRVAQMPQELPPRSSSSRDGRAHVLTTTIPIRSQQQHVATQSSARQPSRESIGILNSMSVAQPEIDLVRERGRLAPAQEQPVAGPEDQTLAHAVSTGEHDNVRRGGRSRYDHSKREKFGKFGEYILGNTIGEGEFGKVKLGWKQEGGLQVAIKLIKKDALGSNPTRMAKIMREVSILKQLTHPNIVRLHKWEETERHFGIVLEYASGGELFDYILNHRYLKDNAARRLFAQLVSGVGYLHKNGIVHRDLKLENLLLDRNRNIIITDFGFANTFDPHEELSGEEELGLTSREFVKRIGLDRLKSNGHCKGDLMQTSCGSPCYAAPELVVSDCPYTGRKVDVWSCGVILYAMLAGYLPFDDDPANPEGDNINLLYKYIVNTPLTFPEYVTPHARDLLRRMLVPNPRKRADLFEVARHSWLSEYAHVVESITSSTTTTGEIQSTSAPSEDGGEASGLGRSASVRESSKKSAITAPLGGLVTKQGAIDSEAEAAFAKQQRENKRRTVQVEYVAPNTTTQRGDSAANQSCGSKNRARSGNQGPIEVGKGGGLVASSHDIPSSRDPRVSKDLYVNSSNAGRRPQSSHRQVQNRVVSDNTFSSGMSGARPPTGGSMQSTNSRVGSRASYGQPVPPELADTSVHGRIQQPPKTASKNYMASSATVPLELPNTEYGAPNTSVPSQSAQVSRVQEASQGPEVKGHRRSSTMGEIGHKLFGRSGSIFGGRNRKRDSMQGGERSRKYPPVSMNNSMLGGDEPRPSMESKQSRRSFSTGLGKKRSGSIAGSQNSEDKKHSRRFSFIPPSFSARLMGLSRDGGTPPAESTADLPIQEPPAMDHYGRHADSTPEVDLHLNSLQSDGLRISQQRVQPVAYQATRQVPTSQYGTRNPNYGAYRPGAMLNMDDSQSSLDKMRRHTGSASDQPILASQDDGRRVASSNRTADARMLQKNKRFVDAWDSDEYSRQHDHSGSSGPARRVMDFFRRRGRARGGESG